MLTKKNLCTLTIICTLTCLPIFAEEAVTNNCTQKSAIEINKNIISEQSLKEMEKDVYRLSDSLEHNQAIETANALVILAEKFYGKDHIQTGFAYLARARIYTRLMMPSQAKQDLDIVYQIAEKNADDKNIRSNILNSYSQYYANHDAPTDALKYLNLAIDCNDPLLNPLNNNKKLAEMYSKMDNILKEKEYFDKYLKSLEEAGIKPKEYNTYMSFSNLYRGKGEFVLAAKYLDKAESLVNKNDLKNVKDFNNSKIEYYIDTKQLDEAILLLEDNIKLIGDNYYKDNIILNFLACYKEAKDVKNFKKYEKLAMNYYKSLPEESLLDLRVIEREIDLYIDINNIENAEKAVSKALHQLCPVKDIVPSLYAKYMKKAGEVKIKEGNFEEAEEYLNKAFEYYKKNQPETAFAFFEVHKEYGNLYNQQGKIDEAIDSYQKAADILIKHKGEITHDLPELYMYMANMYLHKNSPEKAVKLADKAVEVIEQCFGENSIKTIEYKLNKFNVYSNAGLNNEADTILKEINDKYNNNVISGTLPPVLLNLNITNGYIALDNNKIEEALAYAETAKNYVTLKEEKIEIYRLLHEIHKRSGKKFKAYKYKKLGKIE